MIPAGVRSLNYDLYGTQQRPAGGGMDLSALGAVDATTPQPFTAHHSMSISEALLGTLFGCFLFFLILIIVVGAMAMIRAIDYYILGNKDVRKELLNGEDATGEGNCWKYLQSWRPNGRPGKNNSQIPKPHLWKSQMFHH
jgi:hypothetical protein